jgi:antirestriction protein ArdC
MEGKITRPLRHNGIPYQGINVVMPWLAAATKGYASPFWLTFKQTQHLGGNVMKGEHSELVVDADRIISTDTNDKSEERERSVPFMKGHTVFSAEQCEGAAAHFTARAEPAARTSRGENDPRCLPRGGFEGARRCDPGGALRHCAAAS